MKPAALFTFSLLLFTSFSADIHTLYWGNCYWWSNNCMSTEISTTNTPGSMSGFSRIINAPSYYAFLDGYEARKHAQSNVQFVSTNGSGTADSYVYTGYPKQYLTKRIAHYSTFTNYIGKLRKFECGDCTINGYAKTYWGSTALTDAAQEISGMADPTSLVLENCGTNGLYSSSWFPVFRAMPQTALYGAAANRTLYPSLGVLAWKAVALGEENGFSERLWKITNGVCTLSTTFETVLSNEFNTASRHALFADDIVGIAKNSRKFLYSQASAANQALSLYDRSYLYNGNDYLSVVTNWASGYGECRYRMEGESSVHVDFNPATQEFIANPTGAVNVAWAVEEKTNVLERDDFAIGIASPRLRISGESASVSYNASAEGGYALVGVYSWNDDDDRIIQLINAIRENRFAMTGSYQEDGAEWLAITAHPSGTSPGAIYLKAYYDYPETPPYYVEAGPFYPAWATNGFDIVAVANAKFHYSFDAKIDVGVPTNAVGINSYMWPQATAQMASQTQTSNPLELWLPWSLAVATNEVDIGDDIAYTTTDHDEWDVRREEKPMLVDGASAWLYGAYSSAYGGPRHFNLALKDVASRLASATVDAAQSPWFRTDPEKHLGLSNARVLGALPTQFGLSVGFTDPFSPDPETGEAPAISIHYTVSDGEIHVEAASFGQIYAKLTLTPNGNFEYTPRGPVGVDTKNAKVVRANWNFRQLQRE